MCFSFFFFFFLKNIYLFFILFIWLHWVFIATPRLSVVVVREVIL